MAFRGVDIPPYFRVLPPSVDPQTHGALGGMTHLRIVSGAGFGVGTHETTQLCLLALGQWLRSGFAPKRVLDFRSGSGILSVAAALSGARVEAVEIDAAAIENGRENARVNEVEPLIDFRTTLSQTVEPFELVLANILAGVLIEYAKPLCARVSAGGRLVLSGLVGTDVPGVLATYKPLLGSMRAEVYSRGDWRAITFVS